MNALVYLLPAVFVIALSVGARSGSSSATHFDPANAERFQSLNGPFPTATPIPPGHEDVAYAGDGKYDWSALNSVIESLQLHTDGSTMVTYETTSLGESGLIHIDSNGDNHVAHPSTCTTGCSAGNFNENATPTPMVPPPPPEPNAHIGGMDGFEMAVYNYDGDKITQTVIQLGPGNAAVPGIAHLGGTRYAVSGFANQNFIFGEVDTSQSPPFPINTINISTNDFGFDVGFPPVLTGGPVTGYAVGRGGNDMLLCKATFPGAVLVPTFGTGGCVITDLNGGTAVEGREVAMLSNGDAVVAGQRSGRFFIAVFDGTTGALDPAFDGDGLWIESLPGSTESQGWSVVARNSGIYALGWARIGGVRELVLPVFDGFELDPRYENGGIIRAPMVGTEGFPISLKLGAPPPPGNLPELRLWAAGSESGLNQGFVYRFAAVEPTRIFSSNFEDGTSCDFSNGGSACPEPRTTPPHPGMSVGLLGSSDDAP